MFRNKEKDYGDKVKETSLRYGKDIFTYKDYLQWEDDQRYELIDGVIYTMAPAPDRLHQDVLGQLYRQIADYLDDRKCKVYLAPFDLRLPEDNNTKEDDAVYTVVQPDLLIVCDQQKLDKKGCLGAPDLIMEIVSPGSKNRDRKIKKNLYEKYGVKEYWLVNYQDETVEVFLLKENSKYGEAKNYKKKEQVPVNIFDDFKINFKKVFRD